MELIPMMVKLNFQHQSSVSHDPSEIILICRFFCSRNISYQSLKIVFFFFFLLNIFVETLIHYFSGFNIE